MIANGFGIPPETPIMSDASRPHPSFYFRHIEEMRNIMVLNGDAAKQVWIMETGYTTDTRPGSPYAWSAVPDEATKGDYIIRSLQYAKQTWEPWIAVVTIWTLSDPEWDANSEQYYWAITNPDGTPRDSYVMIANARNTPGVLP
jgi:hypothetical protein